jgi:hypothetical protein
MNTRCTCEKDILALRLFADNWRTGASRLQHDVTCVGSCVVKATLCLLIQPNCIKLQPSANILIWVVRLFDHPVFKILCKMVVKTVRSKCTLKGLVNFFVKLSNIKFNQNHFIRSRVAYDQTDRRSDRLQGFQRSEQSPYSPDLPRVAFSWCWN